MPERSGSGQHVHVSLVDRSGRNVFDNGTPEGSELLRYAAGGLAALMAESMAFFAPNVNSYRRFAPDMFAPVNRRWGVNNRSAGLARAGRARMPRGASSIAAPAPTPIPISCWRRSWPAFITASRTSSIPDRVAVGNVSREPDLELPFSLEDALKRLETAPVLPGYFGAEAHRPLPRDQGRRARPFPEDHHRRRV